MNSADSIESMLVDYLQTDHLARGPLDVDTDLIVSGWLDSLLVMDLVCFVESRFKIRMAPGDITPRNLRSVKCLARYVSENLAGLADAA